MTAAVSGAAMFGSSELGYRMLRKLHPRQEGSAEASMEWEYGLSYADTLREFLGDDWAGRLRERTVVDFGCGNGRGSVELAKAGAARVIGIDIRTDFLDAARARAEAAGVATRCTFTTATDVEADIVVSIDAFEHFDDPAAILGLMRSILHPGGEVLLSFGPTWYHPHGGHLFSPFPWAHLIFSERALIRWRADFKHDGARRFTEVKGGLNMMTISRFERLVADSGFELASLRLVPIRALRKLHTRLTREFLTSLVQCRLVKQQVQSR
ncbi:MAG TPA: class I SAM-dependent methyltransferase [Rhodanobacteraceae bacterium]|nr:class I SAM-dependent methyltransferase [Rhodanobacteraceae bacterium]